jgi:hypothetical protein
MAPVVDFSTFYIDLDLVYELSARAISTTTSPLLTYAFLFNPGCRLNPRVELDERMEIIFGCEVLKVFSDLRRVCIER